MNNLIEFTNLLHKEGRADSPAVLQFLKDNANDPTFSARAKAVLMGYSVRAEEIAAKPRTAGTSASNAS